MEEMTIRPGGELKNLWVATWGIVVAVGAVFFVFILALTREAAFMAFSVIAAAWVVVMLLILVWIPAYCRTLEYVIGGQAVLSRGGVFWKKHVTIPFRMITHLDVTQGPMERAFGIGAIHIQTAGSGGQEASKAELKLLGVKDLEGIKEAVMARIRGKSGPAESAPGAAGAGDVFERILGELSAIRELLEKK